MTREELRDEAEWEGGLIEYISGCGCAPTNLPEDVPDPVFAAWHRLYYQGSEDIKTIEDWLWAE